MVDTTPQGGWSYHTSINGVPLIIQGVSPTDAMAKTREYFFTNNIPFDENKFWIEANLQWIEKTDVRHHIASAADILAMRDGAGPGAPAATAAAHQPSEWGSVAWRFLGLVLAKDRYDAAEFISVMRMVVDMLNPSTNPRLGCEECHTKAAMMLNQLIHNPPADIAAARDWLYRSHNAVNARLDKPQIELSEAARSNFWT